MWRTAVSQIIASVVVIFIVFVTGRIWHAVSRAHIPLLEYSGPYPLCPPHEPPYPQRWGGADASASMKILLFCFRANGDIDGTNPATLTVTAPFPEGSDTDKQFDARAFPRLLVLLAKKHITKAPGNMIMVEPEIGHNTGGGLQAGDEIRLFLCFKDEAARQLNPRLVEVDFRGGRRRAERVDPVLISCLKKGKKDSYWTLIVVAFVVVVLLLAHLAGCAYCRSGRGAKGTSPGPSRPFFPPWAAYLQEIHDLKDGMARGRDIEQDVTYNSDKYPVTPPKDPEGREDS